MKKTNWWIWERPASLFWTYTAACSATYPLVKIYDTCYAKDLYGFFRNGIVRWMCDLDRLTANGKKVISVLSKEGEFEKKEDLRKEWEEKLRNLYKKFEKTKFEELNDEDLLKLFNDFDYIYRDWWGITQVAELIAYGGEDILKKNLTEEQFKKYFSTLVTPTKKSYTNEEENEIFEIVTIARKKGIEDEEVKKRIKEHTKKYHWLQNNFHDTKRLTKEYFTNIVKKHLESSVDVNKLRTDNEERLERVKKEKDKIMDELNFKDDLRKLVWLIDEFCFLQDLRKSIDMQANGYFVDICKEVAKRKNIDFDLLRYALPDQVRDLLSGKEIGLEVLKKQKKHCVIIFNDRDYSSEVYSGEEAERKEKEILGEDVDLRAQTEIEGMCASTGRCTGKVRQILNARDISKLQQGEVLVATMTSPDLVAAMKKANAIITDEGGITSHAAIVSRELGIPCVIGTKIATKVLNDGDLVEIKANHGLIKILKKG